MKILDAIKSGSQLLKKSNIPSYVLDSEILLSETLKKSREKLLTNLDNKINSKELSVFNKYLLRRSKNEPIASTLIPRPETELVVNKLIKLYREKQITILDIGTGSGCIILSLLSELKNSTGLGVDISKKAVLAAKRNALELNLLSSAKFLNKSFEHIFAKKFDLIVSNPPYIMTKDIKNLSSDIKSYEPKIALDGGNDGLDLIKKVIYKSTDILKIKGLLALEIGNKQFKKVSKILNNNNFKVKHILKDYKDNIRCLIAKYN